MSNVYRVALDVDVEALVRFPAGSDPELSDGLSDDVRSQVLDYLIEAVHHALFDVRWHDLVIEEAEDRVEPNLDLENE